jgi:hypothetical protein
MMPTASTVMAWMCAMFSIQSLLKKPCSDSKPKLADSRPQ